MNVNVIERPFSDIEEVNEAIESENRRRGKKNCALTKLWRARQELSKCYIR